MAVEIASLVLTVQTSLSRKCWMTGIIDSPYARRISLNSGSPPYNGHFKCAIGGPSNVAGLFSGGGIEVTAVHNHLLRATPATFYMHIGGHGDPAKMAEVIRSALAVSKTPMTAPAAAAPPPPAIDLDTAQLDQIIGAKGQANGGVWQFNVPRRDAVKADDMVMAP